MDQNIYLLSMPELDSSYQNVLDFASLSAQKSYFTSKSSRIIKGNFVSDTEREVLTLNVPLKDIKTYDYLFFIDENGKTLYYFITNKTGKSSSSCIVDVELDVWSTYLFDHTLMESFVERTHVDRWYSSPSWSNGDHYYYPEAHTVDEGLALGEYYMDNDLEFNIEVEPQNNFIMVSTIPLGKTSSTGGGGTNPPPEGLVLPMVSNSAGTWMFPTTGTISATTPYYPGTTAPHHGIDCANASGTPIYASKAGEAIVGNDPGGFGNYVRIYHGNNLWSYYAHMSRAMDVHGKMVEQGQKIGYMGSTGNSTGNHLHWEIRKGGTAGGGVYSVKPPAPYAVGTIVNYVNKEHAEEFPVSTQETTGTQDSEEWSGN